MIKQQKVTLTMEQAQHKVLGKKMGFEKYFLIEYVGLSLVGFDFSSAGRILRRSWIPIITGMGSFFIMAGSVHCSATHLNDLDVVTDAMAPVVQFWLAFWKYTIIFYKRKEMMDLLKHIWSVMDQATATDLAAVTAENKTHWRLSFIYCTNAVFAVSFAIIMPLIMGTFSCLTGNGFIYKTPLTSSYPVDVNQPLNYMAMFIMNILFIYLVAGITVSVDSLYSWSVHNIVGQFKVLQKKIEALNDDSQHGANDGCIRESIIHCINFHQQTIDLAVQLNSTFRPIALAEFTLNSTQLCLLTYQIGRGLNMTRMPFLCSFVMTILVQLLLYSYGGQHLENESERVALCIYESMRWQFWSIRERKALLFSIMRAQRPAKMSAIFFDVNNRIFLWVIQTAASYVALLRSMEQ